MSDALDRIRNAVLRLRPTLVPHNRSHNINMVHDDDDDDDDDDRLSRLGPLGQELQRLRRRISGELKSDDDINESESSKKRMKMFRPKVLIPRRTWFSRMETDKCSPSRKRMNEIVMNLLVIEGFKDVAEAFEKEAHVSPTVPLETIEERMKLRNNVCNGQINEAINSVNEMNPLILKNNPQLKFHLLQQQLIEIIRENKIDEAIEFAQNILAPEVTNDEEQISEVEEIMTLILFSNPKSSPLSHLLEHSRRIKIATELNEAVLDSQHSMKDAILPHLLKRLSWRQKKLADQAEFPHLSIENKEACEASKFTYSGYNHDNE